MPGYPKFEKYAPERTENVDTLEKRFDGLTDTQVGLLAIPTITVITIVTLVLLNKDSRKNPAVYISLFISCIHLYHHYTLVRLQNKIK
tara:strand:+ start:2692 stop:2955 length:264 start_codon:yes stop_codon:yes gene_type:complete